MMTTKQLIDQLIFKQILRFQKQKTKNIIIIKK